MIWNVEQSLGAPYEAATRLCGCQEMAWGLPVSDAQSAHVYSSFQLWLQNVWLRGYVPALSTSRE